MSYNPGMVSLLKTWETIETWDIGLDWGAFNIMSEVTLTVWTSPESCEIRL